jgi:hypothetical protein
VVNTKLLFSSAFVLVAAGCAVAACDGDPSNGPTSSGSTSGAGAGGSGGSASGGSTGEGGGLFGGSGGGVLDSDGDGITDLDEGRYESGGPVDTDMDGTPDYLDDDTDSDGLLDKLEGTEDWDNDGIPNWRDPYNDGDPATIKLTAISTTFSTPIGIDYHQPTNSVVMSANYPTGVPFNFERIEQDGSHQQFSVFSGLTDEVKIGTVRPDNPQGFVAGELFVGNGIDGQIARISPDGGTIVNPWVDLPGNGNGLMRGGLYVDRTNLYGGDLIAVTDAGEVWRITEAGVPTLIASVGVHLEGLVVVPDSPLRFGPIAGKIVAGAEAVGLLYAIDSNGAVATYDVGVLIEDIDLISPNENFFGVNFGTSQLLGAAADQFNNMLGDILLTQETHTATGIYRLKWDGMGFVAQPIPITMDSATVGQWEHVTFAPAGINEIPEVPPPK